MKNLFFAFAFLIPVLFSFKTPEISDLSCPAPVNVHKVSQGTGTISFDWNDYDGAAGYKVKFVRQSDGYTSPETTVTSSNYTFSGLAAGTYTFYFTTDCGSGKSEIIGHEDIITG